MTDHGGDTVSMAGDAEERPPDSGAVPDASTEDVWLRGYPYNREYHWDDDAGRWYFVCRWYPDEDDGEKPL